VLLMVRVVKHQANNRLLDCLIMNLWILIIGRTLMYYQQF